jgi:hypothetical protein
MSQFQWLCNAPAEGEFSAFEGSDYLTIADRSPRVSVDHDVCVLPTCHQSKMQIVQSVFQVLAISRIDTLGIDKRSQAATTTEFPDLTLQSRSVLTSHLYPPVNKQGRLPQRRRNGARLYGTWHLADPFIMESCTFAEARVPTA